MVSYSKLEVNGEWHSHSDESTQVLITFGSISLNILDKRGEPLRQWAYSSIFLKTREPTKSMFCPDMEATECLYIFDCDAVNQLIFLCNKTQKKRITKSILWFFLIIFLFFSYIYFSDYFRKFAEKIAASITSAEQESNLGNTMFSNMSDISYCDINKLNNYIRTSNKTYRSRTNNSIELIFTDLEEYRSILFPGGKLLVPVSILEEKDGAFKLTEITKLAMEAIRSKKAIREFFSQQRNKALLSYIFGNFTDLNFDMDYGLFINLSDTTRTLDTFFNNNEWHTIKNICKI